MTTFKKWIEGKDHKWRKEGKVTIHRNQSSLTCECVCVWGVVRGWGAVLCVGGGSGEDGKT